MSQEARGDPDPDPQYSEHQTFATLKSTSNCWKYKQENLQDELFTSCTILDDPKSTTHLKPKPSAPKEIRRTLLPLFPSINYLFYIPVQKIANNLSKLYYYPRFLVFTWARVFQWKCFFIRVLLILIHKKTNFSMDHLYQTLFYFSKIQILTFFFFLIKI